MGPRPRGEDLEEENARRGSARSHRVTPACEARIRRMRKPLKPCRRRVSWQMLSPTSQTARREGAAERRPSYRRGRSL